MLAYVANNLYRGPMPDSLADLPRQGIQATVDLMNDTERHLCDSPYLNKPVPIMHLQIPCDDITPPSLSQVREFIDYVLWHASIANNVYVHCKWGKDRTGFMVAAYRIKVCKWPFWSAVREWQARGLHMFPYFWWIVALWRIRNKI